MKSDIDHLMALRGLDAIVIEGPDGLTSHNAAWNYFVRGQHLSGSIIKKRDEPARLIYGSMERLQAEATGLELVSNSTWNWPAIIKRFPDDLLGAAAELWRQRFADFGIRGRVGWYGVVQSGAFLARVEKLREVAPDVRIVGEFDKSVIDEARRTKDPGEIDMLADVGRRAAEVVGEVLSFIRRQHAAEGVLVDARERPITIGQVKALVRREMEQRQLEHPDPLILAQGRDAGIAHASGDDAAPLRLGEATVLDFFPRDRASGYYHDMTRTLAIGFAPPELQKVYDDVRAVFDRIMRCLKPGERARSYQDMACELFRQRGHKTIDQHWPLEEGYFHSLGHGLGLEVHEPLVFSSFVDRGHTLEPGSVFTIEPGLYYPQRKIGVRIEDTVAVMHDGTIRSLTPVPCELVLPLGRGN